MTNGLHFTEAQYAAMTQCKAVPATPTPMQKLQALGRMPVGKMNKTELKYSQHLELLKHLGEILWWKFEGIKLRLADNTFLTVDFPVLMADGSLEMREVKGFWKDDARAKIKIAASLYPFRFRAFKAKRQKDGGGWAEEVF